MCGIAGILGGDREAPVDEAVLRRMADVLRHRGPDGDGLRVRPGYGLAHRRLSIVDIGGGAQPMSDATGRYWVTYNGEIYNHLELRAELELRGHAFRTHCDTEVLVNGYAEWGERLPEKLRGMFSFAIVDEQEHVLFAARDRVGKKPFYWARVAGDFVFGSELKALVEDPRLPRHVDAAALRRFFCLGYVPDPLTIFEGVRKLRPGHSLTVRGGVPAETRYWALTQAEPRAASVDEFAEEILELLDDAVRVRLMGEVPLGAFLSGGIDSYAVVDSMSRVSATRVVACAMGFADRRWDERPYARAAAAACGAELHEETVGPEAMLDRSWFDAVFDEPFADQSSVPTYHVSRLARKHVTVALSGDGGDESFAGYRRYKFDVLENRIRSWAPSFLWGVLGNVYPKVDFLPRWLRFKRTFQNLALDPGLAYARSVSAILPEELTGILRGAWLDPTDDPLDPVRSAYDSSDGPDALSRALAADFATWLPGDILTKVDRTSMAVSLEVRAPFLDHHVVEAAARIPSKLRLRGGESKAMLKYALRDRLAADALHRKKQGFHVPLRDWFAGPVGDALEQGLADDALGEIVDVEHVAALLRQHRAGLRDHQTILWGVHVLHRFLRRWVA